MPFNAVGYRLHCTSSAVRSRSRELLDSLDVDLPVDTLTGRLSVAQQQMVEIAKALNRNTRILVMDEPSAVLSERDIENLFAVVRRLQASGIGIIYISHRLREIFELADEVTVLKDGRYVDTKQVADVDMEQLVNLMIGRDLEDVYPKRHGEPGEVVLEVSHLAQAHLARDVSFQLRAGEIVGFAGITGSGRTEVARVIFGADKPTAGEMKLHGQPYRPRSPRDAINQGVALVTELPTHACVVYGDAVRIRQLIENLLSNAVKFTTAGQITLSLTQDSHDVYIAVADTGIGIAEDELEQVFAPFYQAQSFLNRPHGGTGLGLTLSRRLAALMGGEISAQSRVGVGSCFTVRLPRHFTLPDTPTP